jgi:hypothetical protein
VHGRLFEGAGPLDVRVLVEAGLELDDGDDLHAGLGGAGERLDVLQVLQLVVRGARVDADGGDQSQDDPPRPWLSPISPGPMD